MTNKTYLLALLTALAVSNYMDRTVLGIVLQSIKTDFHLSDSQLGFLSGIAFALFYSVLGVPIARWADRGNRVTVISVTAALWSICVALCGIAQNFVQLVLIRVGVAVGEAGCVPPAFSLIADYFTRAERARAAAIYGFAGPIAIIIGYFFAGWLNQVLGWRWIFILMGLPGLGLAVLARLTLTEPRRSTLQVVKEHSMTTSAKEPSIPVVVKTLWRNKTFRSLALCQSILFFFYYGVLQWQPTFVLRTYHLQTGQLGSYLAAMVGVSGLIGSFLGGEWSSRSAANQERRQLRALAIGTIAVGLVSAATYLAPNLFIVFGCITIANAVLYALQAPLFGTLQTLVADRMRAVAFSLIYMFANLIGLGFGPLSVGIISDLFHRGGASEADALRYALLSLVPLSLICAALAWTGSKTVEHDIETSLADGGIVA